MVGAFSAAGAAGEAGVSFAGSGLASAFGAALTSAAFGTGLAFTSALGSSLAVAVLVSALGVAAFAVVFLADVARLRVVVFAAGLASMVASALDSAGVSSALAAGFAAA